MKDVYKAYIRSLDVEISGFLFDLVKIRSYPNDEMEACDYCFNVFSKIEGLKVRKLPMDNTIKQHPLWCSGPYGNNDYTGHYNIEVVWEGRKTADPIYLNAHIDTVPVSERWSHLLSPRIENGILYGLGACDDKGGIASIYSVFKTLSYMKSNLPFDVVGHIVVEEEIGGNGALAATDRELKGQAAVVLEPSSGVIWPVARCGLWLKMTCEGEACHTAAMQAGRGMSAFDLALKAIGVLRAVHDTYKEECKQNPVRYYEDYIPPLNIGAVNTGDWPAKVPDRAVVLASVAVLPNSTNAEMKKKIAAAFEKDEDLRKRVICEYVFDRDSSVLDFDHPLVSEFVQCAKANGYSAEVTSMKCLCDKYFYQELHGIPSISFGPGDMMDAHAESEKVEIKDILNAATVLLEWLEIRARKS